MWNDKKEIKRKIREKQREMYRLARRKGLSDPEVYLKSCELDNLIVEYMKKYNNVVRNNLFAMH